MIFKAVNKRCINQGDLIFHGRLALLAPAKFTNDIFGTGKIYQIVSILKSHFAQLFNRKNFSSLFLIGLLNGLLPCGLVFMAIAGALSLGDFSKSIIFMTTFGAATLPIMLSISFFGTWLNAHYSYSIKKLIPVSVFIMAVMLIVRGLNLGIPYLSPTRNLNSKQIVSCQDTKENINCVKIK